MNINKVKINNELISRCKPDFSICRLKGFPSAPFPLRLREPNTKKPKCNMQGTGLLLWCEMHPYSLRLYPAWFMFEACVQMCLRVCMHMHVHVHGDHLSTDSCLASISFLHDHLDPLHILPQHLLWSHDWLCGFQSCTSKAL